MQASSPGDHATAGDGRSQLRPSIGQALGAVRAGHAGARPASPGPVLLYAVCHARGIRVAAVNPRQSTGVPLRAGDSTRRRRVRPQRRSSRPRRRRRRIGVDLSGIGVPPSAVLLSSWLFPVDPVPHTAGGSVAGGGPYADWRSAARRGAALAPIQQRTAAVVPPWYQNPRPRRRTGAGDALDPGHGDPHGQRRVDRFYSVVASALRPAGSEPAPARSAPARVAQASEPTRLATTRSVGVGSAVLSAQPGDRRSRTAHHRWRSQGARPLVAGRRRRATALGSEVPGAVAFGLAAAIPVLVATAAGVPAGMGPRRRRRGDRPAGVRRPERPSAARRPVLPGVAAHRARDLQPRAAPVLVAGRPGAPRWTDADRGDGRAQHALGPRRGPRRAPARRTAAHGRRGPQRCVATAWALPVEVPYEVWNCWAAVFAFTLLPFLAWAVGTGHYRLLPLLAAVASFVVQCHLTYVAPTLVAVAVAAVGLALWLRRSAPAPTGSRPRPIRRWVAAAALVGLVCWSAPLVEQVEHRPGNVVRLSQLATNGHPTLGSRAARNAVAATVGVPPLWLAGARRLSDRIEIVGRSPSPVSGVSACLVLGGLALCCGLAWRRRRHDLVVGTALALGLCAALVPDGGDHPGRTARLRRRAVRPHLDGLRGDVRVARARLGHRRARPPGPTSARGPSRDVAGRGDGRRGRRGVAASARRAADPQRLPPQIQDYRLIREAMGRVEDATAGERTVFVDVATPDVASELPSAILYALRRRGARVVVAPRVRDLRRGALRRDLPRGRRRRPRRRRRVRPASGARPLLAGGGYAVSLSRPAPETTAGSGSRPLCRGPPSRTALAGRGPAGRRRRVAASRGRRALRGRRPERRTAADARRRRSRTPRTMPSRARGRR